MSIRLLNLRDTSWLEILHRASFQPTQCWDATFFSSLLAQQGSIGLAYIVDDTPVAFVLARLTADMGEILTIAVDPAKRRNGYAFALMQELLRYFEEKKAQDVLLEVAVNNIAAISLYENLGFEKAMIRKNYYKQPDGAPEPFLDCHVMRKITFATNM